MYTLPSNVRLPANVGSSSTDFWSAAIASSFFSSTAEQNPLR
jgi:hypothetical protein